jgi:hypothetical protein
MVQRSVFLLLPFVGENSSWTLDIANRTLPGPSTTYREWVHTEDMRVEFRKWVEGAL